MTQRRGSLGSVAAMTIGTVFAPASVAPALSATERLNELGPETEQPAKRIGI